MREGTLDCGGSTPPLEFYLALFQSGVAPPLASCSASFQGGVESVN
jgi:hypothetical protein